MSNPAEIHLVSAKVRLQEAKNLVLAGYLDLKKASPETFESEFISDSFQNVIEQIHKIEKSCNLIHARIKLLEDV